MKRLKNTELINPKFAPTLKLLDKYVEKHELISKLIVFGPSIENEAYINSDEAELYLAIYFKEEVAKDYTKKDFSHEANALELEIPYVLTYTMQAPIFKPDARICEDVAKGIVIFDSTIKHLKNTEKINPVFKKPVMDMDAFVERHPDISKVIAFGPKTFTNEPNVGADDEICFAIFFKDPSKHKIDDIEDEAEYTVHGNSYCCFPDYFKKDHMGNLYLLGEMRAGAVIYEAPEE